MMNILFLTKEFPWPITSGARMRTAHYVRGLEQAGEVVMVCGGQEKGDKKGRCHLFFTGDDADKKISLAARVKALFSPLPSAVVARVSLRMKEAARKAALEKGCDVIVCDGIHMALNMPMDIPCPRILDEHNVESAILGRYFNVTKNPLVKMYVLLEWLKFRRFEERMWRQFDEIHVCSAADKTQVEKRCGHQNVRVVPNGVVIASDDVGEGFKPSRDGQEGHRPSRDGQEGHRPSPTKNGACHDFSLDFSLVYSGLMGWQPNNDAALYFAKEIWPLIKKDEGLRLKDKEEESSGVFSTASSFIPNPLSLNFVIVGKNPSAKVQALAQKDPSITVTGFVEDVNPYIQGADVFVVPLRIGSGTRLKILEAMAMARPVVSTSIGCEGLDVTHGENILIADSSKDFADCVLRLLHDPELRARIAEAGRRLVEEKYDWEKIEARLAEIIKKGGSQTLPYEKQG